MRYCDRAVGAVAPAAFIYAQQLKKLARPYCRLPFATSCGKTRCVNAARCCFLNLDRWLSNSQNTHKQWGKAMKVRNRQPWLSVITSFWSLEAIACGVILHAIPLAG